MQLVELACVPVVKITERLRQGLGVQNSKTNYRDIQNAPTVSRPSPVGLYNRLTTTGAYNILKVTVSSV